MIEFITTHATDLTEALFALLGLFSVVARITPTEKDNRILQKVLDVVHTLGLTKP